jgi:ParB-like chromosome segregation protein Spo0J
MKVITTKKIALSALALTGEFGKRLKAPHVAERAASIAALGMIHEPVVRASDMRIVCGEDRVAAHFVNGAKTVLCKMVECTDEEFAAMRNAENLQRRNVVVEQRNLVVERITAIAAEIADAPPPALPEKRGRGAPKGDRAKARERLAEELGVTAETLRKVEWKAKRAESVPVPGPVVRSLGMTLSAEFTAKAALAQTYIDAANRALMVAQQSLTKMANDVGCAFPPARLQRLHSDVHDLAVRIRGARPCSLCPWCKGLDGYQDDCPACQGTGFITQSQEVAVPRELLDVDAPCVMKGGVLYMLDVPVAQPVDAWGLE